MKNIVKDITNYRSKTEPSTKSSGNTKPLFIPDPHHLQNLDECELRCDFVLSAEDSLQREKMFKWMAKDCRTTLQLKVKTIEHAMRLFDLVIFKSGGFPRKEEVRKIIVTCVFISSKYIEIYPPTSHDYEYISNYLIRTSELMKKQVQILVLIDCSLNISLASDWYSSIYGKQMPEWGFLYYQRAKPSTTMKMLAQTIEKVNKQIEKESKEIGNKKKRQDFRKITQSKINEGTKRLK